MKGVLPLQEIRKQLITRMVETLSASKLPPADSRTWEDFPNFVRPVLVAAGLAAYEADHIRGDSQTKTLLCEGAVRTLERATRQFQKRGAVTPQGDMNTADFTLVPFTFALRSLKRHIPAKTHRRLLARAEALFGDTARRSDRTHDYLNPRGLEALGAYNLYQLTGRKEYLERSVECLDELCTRQYPCGAQPYHTGSWIWGRKPAQGYQFLTAGMMLYLGKKLPHRGAVDYVRRLMDYSMDATNRNGEAFVTVFEGLHKAHSGYCAGRQWVIAAGLGDKPLAPLAATTYRVWARRIETCLLRNKPAAGEPGFEMWSKLDALLDGLHMTQLKVPAAKPFVPPQGVHALPDISTVFVHEKKLDLAMTLLTGYSAFAEADCGNVRLFALTPELTAHPVFGNTGTDPLRADWTKPSEQDECSVQKGKSVLRGRVYTKWDKPRQKGGSGVHNRRLAVTMTYRKKEMILDYRTDQNWQTGSVPSRLLFLLIARPTDQSAVLHLGKKKFILPPSHSSKSFSASGRVSSLKFTAPDGSAIEIIPEVSTAVRVTAEHPPYEQVRGGKKRKGIVKPANEGSLRLCFDGPDALDRGRYLIRFHPAP